VARSGQYGPYLVRGEDRASLPDDLPLDELDVEKAVELLNAPDHDRTLGDDPGTGLPVLVRSGRYGPYVQLGERDAETNEKPRTASLFKKMSLDSVSLDDALLLLSLPRVVGSHPEDGAEVTALNGRYGPYLKWGSETRSLEGEEQIFDISLDEAVAVLATPKTRGRRAAAPPLAELGEDPNSGKPVVVRSGRWGPYVTDGETNQGLRSGDSPETITLDRAAELLAEKRAKGPAEKGAAKRKKTQRKKSPRKKT